MNVRQLECFCAVAETLNFSQAANQLYITQSAVTQQINTLEKELDLKLFIRNTKKVQLTYAGSVFYGHVKTSLNELFTAIHLAKTAQGKDDFSFVIGCYIASTERFVIKLLTAFLAEYPDAKPVILPMRPREILPALLSRKIDCGFIVPEDVPFQNEQVNFIPLCLQKLYVMMRKNHPLACEKTLSPEQLRGYTAHTLFPASPMDFYTTLQVEFDILNSLKEDALPFELNDGKIELLRLKTTDLVITRPNYTIPDDNELVAVPLIHDYMPEYGIAVLPECKKIVTQFIDMAASKSSKHIYQI